MSARKPLLLAIDAGTGSVRASLFDLDGRVAGQTRRTLATRIQAGGIAEQDAPALWAALAAMLTELVPPAGGEIAAVGVSSALGLVVADREGTPLAPVMLWQDRRAGAETRALIRAFGEESLYAAAGRRPDPEQSGPKLLWLKRHQPDLWRRVASAYGIKDWLIQRLTGVAATDRTSASYTLLYDIFAERWHDALVREVAPDASCLPAVHSAHEVVGRVGPEAAAATGLESGLPVVASGPDGSLGALGAGMVAPGHAVDVIGTTDVCFACIDGPLRDRSMRTVLNAYVVPGRFAVGGPMGLTGGALRWFAEAFLADRGGDPFARLDQIARAIPRGAHGLLFVPSLTGDRLPRWDPAARGVVFGLTPGHGPGHVARALLEGCAFAVRESFEAIAALDVALDAITVAGGGAASALWLDIRADILGRPMLVPEMLEATSLGAALAAGVGTGLYGSFEDAVARTVRTTRRLEPDPSATAAYERSYALFVQLRDQLGPVFGAVAGEGLSPR